MPTIEAATISAVAGTGAENAPPPHHVGHDEPHQPQRPEAPDDRAGEAQPAEERARRARGRPRRARRARARARTHSAAQSRTCSIPASRDSRM